ncbi:MULTISPECIES: hypothetical protein [Caldilinea]|uniref:hypothetical protein n=1 Tax=Caldilinea TaxID=233191 RepID=UPI0013967148|nr:MULTISPECIES: hypothetical protein [Caldilinea]
MSRDPAHDFPLADLQTRTITNVTNVRFIVRILLRRSGPPNGAAVEPHAAGAQRARPASGRSLPRR